MNTFKLAAELRSNQTLPERILWERLRNNQVKGLHFRRQHPISDYIVDFYCHRLRLAIELDGKYHLVKEQRLVDKLREISIRKYGIRFLRFTNEQVIANVEGIIVEITKVADEMLQ